MATVRIILHGKAAGDARVRKAVQALRRDGHLIEVRVTWEPGDAARLTAKAVAEARNEGLDCIVAGGGDGTINEVFAAAYAAGLPAGSALGVLPLGTANDFAHTAGVPVDDLTAALRIAASAPPRAIDLGLVDGRPFVNLVSGGFGSRVTVETDPELKRRLGGLAYAITGISRFAELSANRGVFRAEGFSWEGAFIALAIGNGRQAGGGVRLCPNALIDDGLLDLTILPDLARAARLDAFSRLMREGAAALRAEMATARSSWIEVETADDPNGLSIPARFQPKRQMTEETIPMKAIVVTDQAARTAGMKLVEQPEPQAAINDVVVQVHAAGFTSDELTWPPTWTDRLDRDRTPSIPGHELAGVVTALGYGTTGLSVGQRVFGLADWHRDGTLAEYVAIEARNLAPLPGDVDFTVGASLPISGLTAWQGLFQHGRLQAGQSVIAHGAAGAVGSMVTQLARLAGAYVIGTGRAADRQKALDFGANEFVDLDNDALEDVGGVDLVFDVIGGDIGKRSAGLVRAGGTLVSIMGPAETRPADGLAVDFVVESDRTQLSEIVQRVRDGRLRTNIGTVATLDDAVAAFNPTERISGKTIIRVRP